MQITDVVFGELSFDYGWHRGMKLAFCGHENEIALMVSGEGNNIKQEIRIVYKFIGEILG